MGYFIAPIHRLGTEILGTLKQIAAVTLHDPPTLPHRGGVWNVRKVLSRNAESPTGDLLSAAGSGDLTDATAWEARRSQASHAAREREGVTG